MEGLGTNGARPQLLGMQNEVGIQAGLLHPPGNLHMGETWSPEHPETQKTDAALVRGHSHKPKHVLCSHTETDAMCEMVVCTSHCTSIWLPHQSTICYLVSLFTKSPAAT